MLRLIAEQYPVLAGIVLCLVLTFWPPPKRAQEERHRQARLAELEAGGEERFFEERRALHTYGPSSAGPFRYSGLLLRLLSATIAFFSVR